ncbi:hypothetical protein GCM10027168_45320 [Streptomyces capparidis]
MTDFIAHALERVKLLFTPRTHGRHRARPRHAAGAAPVTVPATATAPVARPAAPAPAAAPDGGEVAMVRPYLVVAERQRRRSRRVVVKVAVRPPFLGPVPAARSAAAGRAGR